MISFVLGTFRKAIFFKHSFFAFLIVIGVLASIRSVEAQTEDLSKISIKAEEATFPSLSRLLKGHSLGLGWTQFTSADQDFFGKDAKSSYLNSLSWKWNPQASQHAEVLYSQVEGQTYFFVPNLYFSSVDGPLEISWGRRKLEWNDADEHFQLGLTQSRYLYNAFDSKTEGLIGAFATWNWSSQTNLTLFASPLFVPELGVAVREENGDLVSKNPWFEDPVPNLEVFDRVTPVRYSLKRPDLNSTLLQPAIGMRAESRAWGLQRVGYLYKKDSRGLLRFPNSALFLPRSEITLQLEPFWVYHHVATFDGKTPQGTFLSLAAEWAEAPATAAGVTEQRPSSAKILEVGQGLSFDRGELFVAYLKIWDADPPDEGRFGKSEGSRFPLRYSYTHAAQVGLKSLKRRLFSKDLRVSARAIVDFDQRGAGASAQTEIDLTSKWKLDLQVQSLGLLSTGTPRREKALLSKYRSNDNFSGQVSYVF